MTKGIVNGFEPVNIQYQQGMFLFVRNTVVQRFHDQCFGCTLVVQARHGVLLCFLQKAELAFFFFIDIFAIGDHADGLIRIPEKNLGIDPHPVIIDAVFRAEKVITQVIDTLFICFQNIDRAESVKISLNIFFLYITFGEGVKCFIVRRIRGQSQFFKIASGSVTTCTVARDIHFINILVQFGRRIVKQLVVFNFMRNAQFHDFGIVFSDQTGGGEKHESDHTEKYQKIPGKLLTQFSIDQRYVVLNDKIPFQLRNILGNDVAIMIAGGIPESL